MVGASDSMSVEIDIKKFGDYGLLFASLLDALLRLDHADVETIASAIGRLARQKNLDHRAGENGVVV